MDPDACMPGVNILSTYYTGNQSYTQMSGTSMATPGATGVCLLMLSKNPNLTPRQIDSVIENYAVRDLGTAGKDNTFGAGRINCSLAVAFTPLPNGLRLYRRIMDDAPPRGNGDGIMNPGENMNMPTWILNLDANTRNGVTGFISKRVPDTAFAIIDSVKSFGDVLPNDSAFTGADGFEIAVAPYAVNGQVLQLDLTLKDVNDSTWTNGFDLTVGAPLLSVAGYVVKDSVGGNGNGLLDPGEEADLIVRLHNGGLGNGYNVTGVLSSGNPVWLTVNDPNGAYGTIPKDGTVGNDADRYHVTASVTVPPGGVVPCTVAVSATGYSARLGFSLPIGRPAQPPGTVIWGPKSIPSPPAIYGLYGLAYDTHNDRIYATHFRSNRIYVMSSDSFVTSFGTIAAPNNETACTDIKYCAYDNTFWVASNMTKRIYKIDTAGAVLRYFANPATDYPVGLGWDEVSRTLYLTDRRSVGVNPSYLYTMDTLGNTVRPRIDLPYTSYAGARCLALDRTNTNPFEPTLTMLYTYFNMSTQALDSIVIYESKRDSWQVQHQFLLSDINWNARGIEYDPRDGNYWITIMQDLYPPPPDNSILKVWGFYMPTGIEEKPYLAANGNIGWCRALPNPFSGRTKICYLMPKGAQVRLIIYDAAGRAMRTLVQEQVSAGQHSAVWDGRDAHGRKVAPGIYFYDLITGDGKITGKALLLH
jgi:hypothetical protein